MLKSRQQMRGIGGFTVIIFILFAVIVANFLLTIGKDYMQYWTVRSIVTDVAAAPGAAQRTPQQIWNDINRRLAINSIYQNVERENISFEEDGSGRYMLLNYEVRRSFIGNLDLVATFTRRDKLAP
jgi:hypothetical protein